MHTQRKYDFENERKISLMFFQCCCCVFLFLFFLKKKNKKQKRLTGMLAVCFITTDALCVYTKVSVKIK